LKTSWGLAITGASASNNLVAGNRIGTDSTGTTAPSSNQRIGVYILGSGSGNTVGGTTAAARNVISGNTQNGILIGAGPGSTNNLIEGNYIGTNAAGTAAMSDGGGVVIQTAGNTVGGTAAGAGNLISGNIIGLAIEGANSGTLVAGNLIGTNAAGSAAIPNSTYASRSSAIPALRSAGQPPAPAT
jgi:titin